jgi:hypothetical protein
VDDLIARLTAAIDETEMAARAALAGYPSEWGGYDGCEPATMSSVWQARYHEVFQVMTEEPSAAFIARHLPGADVERMKRRKVADCGPANVYPAQHMARHDPASVLRGCAADRKELAAVQRRIDGHPGPCVNVEGDDPEEFPYDPHDSCALHIKWNKTTLSPYALVFMAERYGLEVDSG